MSGAALYGRCCNHGVQGPVAWQHRLLPNSGVVKRGHVHVHSCWFGLDAGIHSSNMPPRRSRSTSPLLTAWRPGHTRPWASFSMASRLMRRRSLGLAAGMPRHLLWCLLYHAGVQAYVTSCSSSNPLGMLCATYTAACLSEGGSLNQRGLCPVRMHLQAPSSHERQRSIQPSCWQSCKRPRLIPPAGGSR